MAIALVNHTLKAPGANGGTTDAIDTTGADLLVMLVSYLGLSTSVTPTDSKGNTWTARGEISRAGTNPRVRMFYSTPSAVGTGHTFTWSSSSKFPVISILAFSGTLQASVYDTENSNTAGAAATSLANGSLTPSENNCVVVTGICGDGLSIASASINGGFTITDSIAGDNATRVGGGAAYLIQTSAAAASPTWSWTNGTTSAAIAYDASFKAAVVAGAKSLAALGVG